MIRFLQISDIHFHYQGKSDCDFEQMQGLFEEDILNYYNEEHPCDYMLICGDIAFQGKLPEYTIAKRFINRIKDVLGGQVKVFVVPGNHDLQRQVYKDVHEKLRELAISNPSGFIQDSRSKHPLHLKVLYSRFKQFYTFAAGFQEISSMEHLMTLGPIKEKDKGKDLRIDENIRFGWQTELKSEGGYKVYLVGLNTALISCEKDDEDAEGVGHQLLSSNMLDGISTRGDEVKILMAHHPLEFIHQKNIVEERINSRFAIQFYGHVHKQAIKNNNNIVIQSGAYGPTREEMSKGQWPIYNVVDVEIKGNNLIVSIISVEWNGKRFVRVYDNPDVYTIPLDPQNSLTACSKEGAQMKDNQSQDRLSTGDSSYSALTSSFIQSGDTMQQSIIRQYSNQKGYIPTGLTAISSFLKSVELDGNQEQLLKILIDKLNGGGKK